MVIPYLSWGRQQVPIRDILSSAWIALNLAPWGANKKNKYFKVNGKGSHISRHSGIIYYAQWCVWVDLKSHYLKETKETH